jgi:hypothetical protein
MAARRASLHHLDLATHPGAGMLDRLTRSWVLGLSRLEKVKNVLCARCRPESEELVVRVSESPTAADRHETRVSDLREDHGRNFYHLHPSNPVGWDDLLIAPYSPTLVTLKVLVDVRSGQTRSGKLWP